MAMRTEQELATLKEVKATLSHKQQHVIDLLVHSIRTVADAEPKFGALAVSIVACQLKLEHEMRTSLDCN